MKSILHITNGDCAVDVMRQAKIEGEFLPWRDVLHDGPVPKTQSLSELSVIRSNFIANNGWGESEKVRQSFIERDEMLQSYQQYKKITLWFEHDLYDQLQLIQILDWFHQQKAFDIPITLICTKNYLGPLEPEELLQLTRYEEPITKKQLNLGSKAWEAFCSSTPKAWAQLLQQDLTALPFLEGAILRLLEEYPSYFNGLSRTANQSLSIINDGITQPAKVFAENQKKEERIYLGDLSFWDMLDELIQTSPALLNLDGSESIQPISKEQVLSITPFGQDVLNGKQYYTDHNSLDRWLGGVHLTNENVWFWNKETLTINNTRAK